MVIPNFWAKRGYKRRLQRRLPDKQFPLTALLTDPLGNGLGVSDHRWVERRLAPCHVDRKSREIDDAPVPAEAAQIVVRTHQ